MSFIFAFTVVNFSFVLAQLLLRTDTFELAVQKQNDAGRRKLKDVLDTLSLVPLLIGGPSVTRFLAEFLYKLEEIGMDVRVEEAESDRGHRRDLCRGDQEKIRVTSFGIRGT